VIATKLRLAMWAGTGIVDNPGCGIRAQVRTVSETAALDEIPAAARAHSVDPILARAVRLRATEGSRVPDRAALVGVPGDRVAGAAVLEAADDGN
jgi:hypothetical protein